MIIFAIPFRGKDSTNNWEKCVERLKLTLDSISNQTSDEFKCIVACNDIPHFANKYDERFEFIKTSIPVPTKWIEMARDKFYKLTVIAERIKEILLQLNSPQDGVYVMPVDADDYLNINIAQYCVDHPYENGFVSSFGYYWIENEKFLHKYKNMHTFCGSCNIIKMYLEDLPDKNTANPSKCHDQETAALLNSRYPIRFNHHTMVDHYSEIGKPFSLLPFPSTIYVRGTGDNISSLNHNENIMIYKNHFHPIAFLRKFNFFSKKLFNRKMKKQFGLI